MLKSSRADTIFLTYEWIKSWVELVKEKIDPYIITIRDANGDLQGIAPFYMTRTCFIRGMNYRTLRIMGDDSTGAEYLDWIANKDRDEDIYKEIALALSRNSGDWDCAWMPNVANWTGARDRILTACGEARFYQHSRSRDFACFMLPETMEEFVAALSGNRRSQLRRQLKKVFGEGAAVVARCEYAGDIHGFLESLFDLHRRRWKSVGEEGSFVKKPFRTLFYRRFCEAAFQKGWLRLFGLRCGSKFKAIQIGYVYNGVFHQMQEGFDPDYFEGAGNALRYKVIEACIEEGLKAYDFLGEMTEHKRRWTAKRREGCDLFIGRKGWKNTLLFFREIWPGGRFLRPLDLYHGYAAGCEAQ